MADNKKLHLTKQELVTLCVQIWGIRETEYVTEENMHEYFGNIIDRYTKECGWDKE